MADGRFRRVVVAESDDRMYVVSASRSIAGSAFPRCSARRRMPSQASRLKKNGARIRGSVSKTCHNEHPTASLGHSEKLRSNTRQAAFAWGPAA